METGRTYVLDTVAYVSHLLGVLPDRSRKAIEEARIKEDRLILCSISLGEAIYIFLKARKTKKTATEENLIWEMLDRLERGTSITVENLDFNDWRRVMNLPFRDLHDRMIVAVTLRHKATLITNDKEILESRLIPTLW